LIAVDSWFAISGPSVPENCDKLKLSRGALTTPLVAPCGDVELSKLNILVKVKVEVKTTKVD
jgi:hypothetical protein